jgi:hypothetical protein
LEQQRKKEVAPSNQASNERTTMKIFSSAIAIAVAATTVVPVVLSYTSSSWGMQTTRSALMMTKSSIGAEGGKSSGGSFSLGNLFGGEGGGASPSSPTLRGNKNLEPHPSVNPHISPLNRLGPDKQKDTTSEPLPIHPQVRSGTLSNGMPYVILPNKSPPGRFEAHLQVFSGSGE